MKKETGTTDKLSGSDSGKSRRPEVAQDFRDRVILEVKNEGFLTGSHRKYLTARKSQRYIWMYMEVIFGLLSMEREPSWIWLLWKKSGLVKRQNPLSTNRKVFSDS